MTESQPVIEVSVAATPSVVWPALRDPELIRRWHGWDYAGLADEIREIYFDDVTEDAAAFTLALNGADKFSLHEHEGTTLVRITRPPRSGDPAADDWYDDVTEGWTRSCSSSNSASSGTGSTSVARCSSKARSRTAIRRGTCSASTSSRT